MTLYTLLSYFTPNTFIIVYKNRNRLCDCYLYSLDEVLNRKHLEHIYSNIVDFMYIETDILHIIIKDSMED